MGETLSRKSGRKEFSMSAKLIVKSVQNKRNDKVVVYRTMPTDVKAPKLYTEVDAGSITPLFQGQYAYLLKNLNKKGSAYIGSREQGGLKNAIRSIIAGGVVSVPTAPEVGVSADDANERAARAKANRQAGAARAREARKAKLATKNAENNNANEGGADTLVLEINDLNTARDHAKATGDWSHVERILDAS